MANSNITKLDEKIREYLWLFTDSIERKSEDCRQLLDTARKQLGTDIAFVLRVNTLGDGFVFTNVASADSEYSFEGVDFSVDESQKLQLVSMLNSDGVGTTLLSFLGDDFLGSMLYYGVVVNNEVRHIIGVMDLSEKNRRWSEEECLAIKRLGSVLGVNAERERLMELRRYQLKLMEEQVKTEQSQRYILEKALLKAESAVKARRMFLSNMSHDIRTPMNAIIGFAALAGTHVNEVDRVQDYLGKITESGKQLLGILSNVLDISRIESGTIKLDETPYSLRDIFQEVRNVLAGSVATKQLEISMDATCIIHEKVFCDRLRMNQVALNLMSNAVKYTPSGGHIELALRELPSDKEGYARYQMMIKDDGIGMTSEFVKHIYEPFEREQNSGSNTIQGAGLGMAITKNIIDLMGGSIEINSQKNQGTEITITVDLRLQKELYEDEMAFVVSAAAGKRFLVINDSFELCSSIVDILERCGVVAEWTLSPREAILRAKMAEEKGNGYDGFVVDWLIPEMNGLEAVRQLRVFVGNDKPVILMGPGDSTDFEADAFDAGVSSICCAPYFISDMRNCLLRAFNAADTSDQRESMVIEDFMGKRILLAEDNKMNQEIAIALLEEAGFFVDLAENGQVAVDKVTNHASGHYDIILMDIQMPIMDGYEAAKCIRAMEEAEKSSTPIVAMTADAFSEDRHAAIECGMNEHIAKPVDIERLYAILKSLLVK